MAGMGANRKWIAKVLIEEALRLGFEVRLTNGGHYAARHPSGGDIVVFSRTSRSESGRQNTLALLRRIARKNSAA